MSIDAELGLGKIEPDVLTEFCSRLWDVPTLCSKLDMLQQRVEKLEVRYAALEEKSRKSDEHPRHTCSEKLTK